MKHYYVIAKSVYLENAGHFRSSHYIDLDGGEVVVTGEFVDEGAADRWEKLPSCEGVGHIAAPTPVSGKIAARLAKFGVAASHTPLEVAQKLAQVMPTFRP
jgi:hypothetical protein